MTMRCPTCDVDVVPEAVFCHRCGQRLDTIADAVPENRKAAEESSPGPADSFQRAVASRQAVGVPPEEEIWRGGYCPKAMLGAWVADALLSLALLIIGVWLRPSAGWWLFLVVAMVLPWAYHVAVLCRRSMSVRYLLTTQRFVHESGILRRVNDRIELLDIDDVAFEQGLWERLAGVGTIRIASHDRSHPELALRGIEDVKRVSGLLDDARLAERRRRGLHVEQI
jgi:hypothetical protein